MKIDKNLLYYQKSIGEQKLCVKKIEWVSVVIFRNMKYGCRPLLSLLCEGRNLEIKGKRIAK